MYNISVQFKLNLKIFSQRLKPDSCQTLTPPDPTIGATRALFLYIATTVATVRT
jgi:hypothetical protein